MHVDAHTRIAYNTTRAFSPRIEKRQRWAVRPHLFVKRQASYLRGVRDTYMLKIRLRRMGAIRQPHYRIVVADARSPRDGRFIEILGHYNPRTHPATIQVDVAKYEDWKSKGAQPTDAVERLVRQFNRAARQAAAAASATAEGEAAQPAPPASRRTRTASGKGMTRPQPAAEAQAEETAPAEAEAEAATEAPAEPAEETAEAEAPALEAAAETPAGAPEGANDT